MLTNDKLKFFTLLLLQLFCTSMMGQSSSTTNCIETSDFFRKHTGIVCCLEEVLSTATEIKALYIKKNDLIPSSYGELCLLDSILLYKKDVFSKKVQSVESLYLDTHLPEEAIQLLARSGTVKNILLRPNEAFYSTKELQQFGLLQAFKSVQYLEGADTSLAFINCLQQLEQLDTLVWLDKQLQNPYLGQLSTITTLIIGQYSGYSADNKWTKPRRKTFNFPPQLKSIYTEELDYRAFADKAQTCTAIEYLRDKSGVLIDATVDYLVISGGYFPPPSATIKKMRFESSPKEIPQNIHLFSSLSSLKISMLPSKKGLLLPSTFYQLSNLEELEISVASLSDSICYLNQLKELSIIVATPTKEVISDSISCLTNLESLSIYNKKNKSDPLPNSIYELTNLRALHLRSLTLSDSIADLKNLRTLSLTKINNLPDSLICLQNLQHLNLRNCMFQEYPREVYQFKHLDTLVMGEVPYYKKTLMNARELKKLTELDHLEFSFRAIKNEIHYKRLYEALPEECTVELQDGWDNNAPTLGFNFGLYMDYGWNQATFTGVELLYHTAPKYSSSFVKRKGQFKKQVTTKEEEGIPHHFHFHTFSFGVEWNYLPRPNLLMGYRVGYNYSRVKDPIAFQVDFIAYTNYNSTIDLRLAPRIAITPIRLSGMYLYVYYSYKMPLLPIQEQSVVARHSIGLNVRFSVNWKDGLLAIPGVF